MRLLSSGNDANANEALWVRFRIDTRLSFDDGDVWFWIDCDGDDVTELPEDAFFTGVPFAIGRSNRPFIITLVVLMACCGDCTMAFFTWKPCGCRILENGRGLNRSIWFGLRGNNGGDIFSKLFPLINGLRVVDEPAKLFRRLAVLNLFSGSVDTDVVDVASDCRMFRSNSGGGGGGNGSSRFSGLFVNGDGGGGKSGLGTRSNGFFGGRSGIHSSNDMIGPITTGPRRSFEKCCLSMFWSRYAEYSAADEVL